MDSILARFKERPFPAVGADFRRRLPQLPGSDRAHRWSEARWNGIDRLDCRSWILRAREPNQSELSLERWLANLRTCGPKTTATQDP
jgi:hypothetical protein